jgi:hypothetical protein
MMAADSSKLDIKFAENSDIPRVAKFLTEAMYECDSFGCIVDLPVSVLRVWGVMFVGFCFYKC